MINLKLSNQCVVSPLGYNRSNSLSSYKSKRATSKNKNIDIQKLQQSVQDLQTDLMKLNKCNSQKNISNSTEITNWGNDSLFGTKQDLNISGSENSYVLEPSNLSISRKIQEKYNMLNENIQQVEDDCENIENIKISYQFPKAKAQTLKQIGSMTLRQKIDKPTGIVKKIAPSKYLSKKSLNTVCKKSSNEKIQITQKMNGYQQEILKYLGNDKRKQQQKITQLFAQILNVINQK